MPLRLLLLFAAGLLVPQAFSESPAAIEERGTAKWPTRNHFRIAHRSGAADGRPVWLDADLPPAFNPDSVRVLAGDSLVASKTEWRTPHARISWRSTGAGSITYHVYFDHGNAGETERQAAPAMIGSGDRLMYGTAGVRGKLAVGLWAHPAPLDFDGDGNMDLVAGCADRPYNGTYLFRNIGTNDAPLFDRAEWWGPGRKDLVAADFNGDGRIDLVVSGGYYSDVRRNRLARFVPVQLPREYHAGRDDLWYPVDWDGDGKIDVLAGVSDWREYGWDDAYDGRGRWTRGRLHGYVWFHRNIGTNEQPRYAAPVQLRAGGEVLDQYGSPSPNAVDWFGTGRLDLIAGSFLDSITLYRNGGRGELDRGAPLTAGGRPIRMDLCMIQPRAVQWHKDGRGPSLLVAEEDGTVTLFANTAARGTEPTLAEGKPLVQVDPYVKSGALSRPVAVDWNGDGRLDIITGNSAGYIQSFENTGTKDEPRFADRGYLKAGGEVIRRVAGPNGSVQGPAEEKWGYSNPAVADWDLDGKLDLIVNDIWGDPLWYRNTGQSLAKAQSIEVEWPGGRAPKPDWVWWEPKGKQLVTQWRTTPFVVDWDRDGLPDLVMLNHQGYLSLFRRSRGADGALRLGAPERIFVLPNGRFLNMAAGRAGASGRRKVHMADWDNDGDLDLITDSDEGPAWYENTGSQERPVMTPRGTILKVKLAGHNPTPNAADWNGDGRLDLLVGAEDGFFYYFERSYIDAVNAAVR